MKREAAGDQDPDRARLFDPEGQLSGGGGRPEHGRPPTAFRLKRSIDRFPASDGSVYLLHDGLGTHFRIAEPTRSDRLVLDLLARGFVTASDLTRELDAEGLDTSTVELSLRELEAAGLLERRPIEASLSPGRAERFDRQLIYLSDICDRGEVGEQLQARLGDASVVILGCGGLGSWAACGLVCAGIGSLTLIDDDVVELSNLNRQLLFGEPDLGTPKVEAAARALARHDSSLRLRTIGRRMEGAAEIAHAIEGADFLVATADWPPYELARWVNDASIETGVPYISAGQFPPLIRVGPTVVPGRTSCLECQERETMRDYPLYEELARYRSERPSTASTLGAASGMIGSIIAMEAIHLLTGRVEPATLGAALMIDLRTMSAEREPVPRDETCRCSEGAVTPA